MSAADHHSPIAAPTGDPPRAVTQARAWSSAAARTLTDEHHAPADEASLPRSRALADVPERLGRYLVLGTLGCGGMGTVLEAFDRTLDRRVAVKILHRALGQHHAQRLLREAQAMAKLSHPNVVQVYEAGEVDGHAFIAMELVRGQTLADWIVTTPRPGWRRCVEVFLQVGSGLAAAHAQGLVHRDFKPGNAILDLEGRARVLDFGLARQTVGPNEPPRVAGALDDDGEPPSGSALAPGAIPSPEHAALDTPLTRTGAVLGTPSYMPPEQIKGLDVDARSDQFSFCASLYEALYGERPFEGSSLMTLFVAMTTGHVRPPPKGVDVPTRLRQALLRGLSLDPSARWSTMDALLDELRRVIAPTGLRGLALVVAGGLAVAGLGLGLAVWADVGQRCEGAAARLEGVWDEARAGAVRDALLATGVPYAADTWERVRTRLDAYGDAWGAKHTEVCEATSVRQEQSSEVMDLRMACLGRRMVELRATVDVLAGVDVAGVEKAVSAVDRLPALAECDDVEALAAARAELPPPDDPDVAAQVEQARAELASAVARFALGDFVGSEAQAHAVVEHAEGLGYGPLLAEALLRRGAARSNLSRDEAAEADLERAHVLALRHRHERVQLDATAQLVYVVGYQRHRHDDGLRWSAMAEALAERPGADDAARPRVWTSRAAVLLDAGRADEAVEHYRRALALQEQQLGPRHRDVAITAGNLAAALVGQGELEEATRALERGLVIWEDVLGPSHPAIAGALGNLGAVLAMQGRLTEARTYLERSVELKQVLLGPSHRDVGIALGNLGLMLLEQAKLEQGAARQQLLARARERLEAAVTVIAAARGPHHPHVAGALGNLVKVLMEQGALAEARAAHLRALDIMERAHGAAHLDVAATLLPLVEVELALRERSAAREHAERAVAIREAGGAEARALAEARFALARALWTEPEARARARGLAEQAHEALQAEGASAAEDAAAVTGWLVEHPPP